MPLHKTRPTTRGPSSGNSIPQVSGITSHTSHPLFPSNSDKSNQAAQMAQQLASQNSWADAFAPATPATNATPSTSVTQTPSLLDDDVPPPSYEDSRQQSQPQSTPRPNPNPVPQNVSQTVGGPPLHPPDIEPGVTTPLLRRRQDIVKAKRRKQKRFVVVFLILAVWLMGLQALKCLAIGFWRTDGTLLTHLPRRDYSRHETSSSIKGTFTFYDSLDLSTTSGSIDIIIDPQPSEIVGTIRVVSRSGSIKVRFSDDYMKIINATGMLNRTYHIEIRSTSGTQTVEIPQGSGGTTSVTSESGTINLKLHMTRADKSRHVTILNTESKDGVQNIKVRTITPDPILSLAAKLHSKSSGTIKLGLPPAWEGMVYAYSGGSGSVDVKGQELEMQQYGDREIYAQRVRKHEQDSKIELQAIEVRSDGSGSIKVDCSTTKKDW